MSPEIQHRIDRVVKDLRPATSLEERFASPRSVAERLSHLRTPGLSLAVIDRCEVSWCKAFGVREAGTQSDVTTSTLFQAGSIGKSMFALAILRMVQEGVLDLDEDVNAYLSSWQVKSAGAWCPRITLRQLLSHTAGTTVHGFHGYPPSSAIPTLVQVLDGLPPANSPKVEVNMLPGMQFRYSGGGTSIGQQVLIDQTGLAFPEAMRTLVLDPLGMEHSTFEQPIL